MHQRPRKTTRRLYCYFTPRLFSDIQDCLKNLTFVVVWSANCFLHKIPLYVPLSFIFLKNRVSFVDYGVAHFKFPLYSVYLGEFGMLNEGIPLS